MWEKEELDFSFIVSGSSFLKFEINTSSMNHTTIDFQNIQGLLPLIPFCIHSQKVEKSNIYLVINFLQSPRNIDDELN